MEALNLPSVTEHFVALRASVPLHPVTTDEQYDHAVAVLNALLDAGAANESHPLADLAATLGDLIGEYDEMHHSAPQGSGVDALRFLIQQHQLKQSDLPEIGSQGVVSEVLNGSRALNVRHIKALALKFDVPPSVFLESPERKN